MAGYHPTQDGIYISPDVQIPPGMTAYPMQPPTIPHQQQMLDPLQLPQHHPTGFGGGASSGGEQPGYPIQQQHMPVSKLILIIT